MPRSGPNNHEHDNQNVPHLEPVPVVKPFPKHPEPSGSIFELQEQLETSHFAAELDTDGIQTQQQQQ